MLHLEQDELLAYLSFGDFFQTSVKIRQPWLNTTQMGASKCEETTQTTLARVLHFLGLPSRHNHEKGLSNNRNYTVCPLDGADSLCIWLSGVLFNTCFEFDWKDRLSKVQMCISGYQLCDNSVGVLFNDYTRLIMYADGDSLQYIDKASAESYLSVRSYPTALNKKVSSTFCRLIEGFEWMMLPIMNLSIPPPFFFFF